MARRNDRQATGSPAGRDNPTLVQQPQAGRRYIGSPVLWLDGRRRRRRHAAMSSDPHLTPTTSTRTPLPAASLNVDPERLAQMWQLTPDQRVLEFQRGHFTLGEMLRWSARRPLDVPLINGEFFFLASFTADAEPGSTAQPKDGRR